MGLLGKSKKEKALQAAKDGDLATLRTLVTQQRGVVHAVDRYEDTPLHWASCKGHLAVAQFLVQQGARVEAVDKDGRTPLYYAVHWGHRAVAEYLVRAGASLDVTPTDGDPPLRELMAQKGMADALQRAAQERNPPQAAPQPPQPRAAPQAATPHADELRAAAAEASRLRAEVEAANTQLRAAEEKAQAAQRTAEETSAQLRASEQKAQAAQRTADSEAEKRRAAEKGMEAAQRTAEEATAQLRAAEKKADAMAKAMEAAQRTAEETSAQLRAAEAEASRLRHTVAEMEAQLRAAKEELDRMRADYEARTAAPAADNDVAHWLHERDLSKYAGTFAEAEINNLNMMTEINKEDAAELIKFGVHRRFFLAELEKLKAALKGGAKLDTIEAKYAPTDEPPLRGRHEVRFARSLASGAPVVIKVFASKEALLHEVEMLRVMHEAAALSALPVLFVSIDERALVMPRGRFSLRQYVAKYHAQSGSKAGGIIFELLEAIAALHSTGHVHCDIKPGNCITYDMHWRVIDFGGACAVGSAGGAEFEYTHSHVAPEVARALLSKSELRVGKAQDVWALGLTVYFLLAGEELFAWGDDEALGKAAALTQDAVVITPAAVPNEGARKLLAKMLRVAPAERASVVELLADRFVAGNTLTSSVVRREFEAINDRLDDVHFDVVKGRHAAEDAAERSKQ